MRQGLTLSVMLLMVLVLQSTAAASALEERFDDILVLVAEALEKVEADEGDEWSRYDVVGHELEEIEASLTRLADQLAIGGRSNGYVDAALVEARELLKSLDDFHTEFYDEDDLRELHAAITGIGEYVELGREEELETVREPEPWVIEGGDESFSPYRAADRRTWGRQPQFDGWSDSYVYDVRCGKGVVYLDVENSSGGVSWTLREPLRQPVEFEVSFDEAGNMHLYVADLRREFMWLVTEGGFGEIFIVDSNVGSPLT